MQQIKVPHIIESAPVAVADATATAMSATQLPQTVAGTPVVHVGHPDVWAVEKAHDSFWGTQFPPLATIAGVALAVIVKWIWDAKDRKYQLKRKLYFKTVDCMTECNNILSGFCNPNASLDSLQQRFLSATGVIAKTELVAGTDLFLAIADLKDLTGKAFMESIRARLPIEKHRADLQINDPLIRQYQAEIDWVISEQKRMRTDCVRDDARTAELQRRYEFAYQQLAPLIAATKEHSQAISAVVNDLGKLVMDHQTSMLVLSERVKQMMRKDMGFNAKFDLMLKRQAETIEKAKAELAATRAATVEMFTPDSMKNGC